MSATFSCATAEDDGESLAFCLDPTAARYVQARLDRSHVLPAGAGVWPGAGGMSLCSALGGAVLSEDDGGSPWGPCACAGGGRTVPSHPELHARGGSASAVLAMYDASGAAAAARHVRRSASLAGYAGSGGGGESSVALCRAGPSVGAAHGIHALRLPGVPLPPPPPPLREGFSPTTVSLLQSLAAFRHGALVGAAHRLAANAVLGRDPAPALAAC